MDDGNTFQIYVSPFSLILSLFLTSDRMIRDDKVSVRCGEDSKPIQCVVYEHFTLVIVYIIFIFFKCKRIIL